MTPAPALGERFPAWPTFLDEAVSAARARPFDWRQHNCATFAADCVQAVTGVALHRCFAQWMASTRSARRQADALDLHADSIVGADRRIPVALAQRGDLVIVRTARPPALAICMGVSAAAVGPAGLVFVPMGAATCAWRI
jgi:hypothetical protein